MIYPFVDTLCRNQRAMVARMSFLAAGASCSADASCRSSSTFALNHPEMVATTSCASSSQASLLRRESTPVKLCRGAAIPRTSAAFRLVADAYDQILYPSAARRQASERRPMAPDPTTKKLRSPYDAVHRLNPAQVSPIPACTHPTQPRPIDPPNSALP